MPCRCKRFARPGRWLAAAGLAVGLAGGGQAATMLATRSLTDSGGSAAQSTHYVEAVSVVGGESPAGMAQSASLKEVSGTIFTIDPRQAGADRLVWALYE